MTNDKLKALMKDKKLCINRNVNNGGSSFHEFNSKIDKNIAI